MTSPTALPLLNLRRPEIARVLNIHISVVDGLIRTGELPSFMIGGQRLARFEDVVAFNDSRARQSIADGSKEVDVNTSHTHPSGSSPTPAPSDAAAQVIQMRGRRQKRGVR